MNLYDKKKEKAVQYIQDVKLYRGSEKEGYFFFDSPKRIKVIYAKPFPSSAFGNIEEFIKKTSERIELIFYLATQKKLKHLVFQAFGEICINLLEKKL